MLDLIQRVEKFGSPAIVLVGDFMLDRYVYGNADRLSQEAPVPVLLALRSEHLAGGAGNVASALLALGAGAVCVGMIGSDAEGNELRSILTTAGAKTAGLVRPTKYATTVKTRYIGLAQHRNPQQLLRVDSEQPAAISDATRGTLRAAVRSAVGGAGVVVIQDYNKGAVSDGNCPEIIGHARKAGCKVIVDPAGISDYRRYRGATLVKPNRYEAQLATGITISDDESLTRAAKQIVMATEAEAVAISLDKEGVFLYTADGGGRRFAPPRALAVYDITGAGDVLVAALAVALAEGCDLDQAVILANIAGGLAVERFGAVPVRRDELLDELRRLAGLRSGKILARKQLAAELKRRRQAGQTVVFTNGVFDLLHLGHMRYLRQARQLGSCLVVALNSDAGARRLKGPTRPVIGEKERAEMLAAMEWVDYVTVFEEDTPRELLQALKPDILVKGGSTGEIVGREIVEGYGGQVRKLDLVAGLSTTEIIDRILSAHKAKGD